MSVETDFMKADPVEVELKQARAEFVDRMKTDLSNLSKEYIYSGMTYDEWLAARKALIASRKAEAAELGVEGADRPAGVWRV